MKKLTFLLGLVFLGAAGCGGRDGGTAAPAEQLSTTASQSVPFDRSFIDAMVPHHRSAIKMAREAKQQGLTQPALLKIADDIVRTQQSEIDQMLNWRAEWFGSRTLEPEAAAVKALGLTMKEAGMAHGSGMSMSSDVDQSFAEMMIDHHKGAIRMARLAKQRARHQKVRNLAARIISGQQREIDVLEKHAGGMQH